MGPRIKLLLQIDQIYGRTKGGRIIFQKEKQSEGGGQRGFDKRPYFCLFFHLHPPPIFSFSKVVLVAVYEDQETWPPWSVLILATHASILVNLCGKMGVLTHLPIPNT